MWCRAYYQLRLPTKISFGTEGGLFKQQMHCPIVVCGPGTIEVAHKPNEHVSIAQLEII